MKLKLLATRPEDNRDHHNDDLESLANVFAAVTGGACWTSSFGR